ncbi:hypothetical protein Tco_1147413, partial [Tanacetum coccineum]
VGHEMKCSTCLFDNGSNRTRHPRRPGASNKVQDAVVSDLEKATIDGFISERKVLIYIFENVLKKLKIARSYSKERKVPPPLQKKLESLEVLKEANRKKQEMLDEKKSDLRCKLDKLAKQVTGCF